ncbi:pinensin family lanthipeptide [Longimicrobium sp.]|uniref:pinensin family lanthipeptide n=1 Tax=Longimicrobium sp. TaxID=2029185 RepID=UPI002CC94CDA|nr:pinensin family lanthipeptide [Longimicrobium sp.]HSU15932.1 pinensin family lanthipeptide [Longimicrobium sp.]
MKKMRLNLEQLAVESFETDSDRARRGTVRGHDVCSDLCTYSAEGTCGAPLDSVQSECNALPQTKFCGDTMDICGSQPCCV